jgi:hypothetical protein
VVDQEGVDKLAVGVHLLLNVEPLLHLRVDGRGVGPVEPTSLGPVRADVVLLAQGREILGHKLLVQVLYIPVVVGRGPGGLQGSKDAAARAVEVVRVHWRQQGIIALDESHASGDLLVEQASHPQRLLDGEVPVGGSRLDHVPDGEEMIILGQEGVRADSGRGDSTGIGSVVNAGKVARTVTTTAGTLVRAVVNVGNVGLLPNQHPHVLNQGPGDSGIIILVSRSLEL